mmetsp:Transcript_88457/g.162045  ORF Transcript_88457/g.162045 Transcript_88457/m.162045 type:complete len:220 (-) Transcript_88457:185-844(-)
MTMSSMLPYLARFIPLARVAIQPPRVENSIESGSMPMFTPCLRSSSLSALPVMPASMHATPSALFTHCTRDIPRMSKATKGRESTSLEGQTVADVTFVRPPTGMTAKPPGPAAALSNASTSSSECGRTTASGMRSRSLVRRRQMSVSPWPVPALSLDSLSVRTRSSGSTVNSFSARPSAAGASCGSGCSGIVPRTLSFVASSFSKKDQSLNIGFPPMAP